MNEYLITEYLIANKENIVDQMEHELICETDALDSDKVDYLIRHVVDNLTVNYEEASSIIDQDYLKKIGY